MGILKKMGKVIFLAIFQVWMLTGFAMAIEFSADSIHTTLGRTFKGKIYYKGDKIRIEVIDSVHRGYNIIRKDKNIMWMVMPDRKIWMEVPFDATRGIQFEKKVKGEIDRRFIKTERINGHPTRKYEVTLRYGDNIFKVYQWIATDLDFTIKSAAIDGSWVQELRNIKIGNLPDSLFEIPSGYKKIEIPRMEE